MFILDCTAAEEMCSNLQPFLNVIKVFLEILRWTVPILLIIFGSIDMFNAITKADDEKVIQDSRRKFIKRIIYGIVVFLVPFLVNLVMELIDEGIGNENNDEVTATTWVSCWNEKINISNCSDIYEPEVEPETSSENGNTCNCELCENGTSNCQYAKIAVEACRAEGGTCKTTPTDSFDDETTQKCTYYKYQKYEDTCSDSNYSYLYQNRCYRVATQTEANCKRNNNTWLSDKNICLGGYKDSVKKTVEHYSSNRPTSTVNGKAEKYSCTMSKNLNCSSESNLKTKCSDNELLETINNLEVSNQTNYNYDENTSTYTCYIYYACRDSQFYAIKGSQRKCYPSLGVPSPKKECNQSEELAMDPYGKYNCYSPDKLVWAETKFSEKPVSSNNYTDSNNNTTIQCSKKCSEARVKDCK